MVLSERDKEEMEAELHSTLTEADLMGTQVVFRSGSPLNAFDLRRAACETARSIVVMAHGESQSAADASTLRVVIALKTFPKLMGHVVVEVRTDRPNLERTNDLFIIFIIFYFIFSVVDPRCWTRRWSI